MKKGDASYLSPAEKNMLFDKLKGWRSLGMSHNGFYLVYPDNSRDGNPSWIFDAPLRLHISAKEVERRLISAATKYDMRMRKRKHYNPSGLAIMFASVTDTVMPALHKGMPLREAVMAGFNDRLLDAMLLEVGEVECTPEETEANDAAFCTNFPQLV